MVRPASRSAVPGVAQPDLFAAPVEALAVPAVDPLDALREMLDGLRGASVLPWPDAAAAMVAEHRAVWLAGQAGDEGARLLEAIFEQTERLFCAAA